MGGGRHIWGQRRRGWWERPSPAYISEEHGAAAVLELGVVEGAVAVIFHRHDVGELCANIAGLSSASLFEMGKVRQSLSLGSEHLASQI